MIAETIAEVSEKMNKAVDVAEKDWKGIVVGNDGSNFSAGANIAMLLWAIKDNQWDDVRKLVGGFQQANAVFKDDLPLGTHQSEARTRRHRPRSSRCGAAPARG